MNETLALARYQWTRIRVVVNGSLAFAAIGFLIAGIAWQMELPRFVTGSILSLMCVPLLLCLFLPIAMFNFSSGSGLLDPNSGYDPWIMRLPLPNWKLAIIPVGLVTALLSTVWITIAVMVRLFDGRALPLTQALAMSASAISYYSLSWKPQRSGWHRIALLGISLPLLYVMAFGALFVWEKAPQWLPQAEVANGLIYAASIGFALYSVKQARVSTFQQSRSTVSAVSDDRRGEVTRLSFAADGDALQWHDCSRLKWTRSWRALFMVPMPLMFIAVIPLNAATAIVVFLILALITMTLASSRVEPSVHGFQSSLPSYLLASPISSRSMAWTRLRGYAIEHCQLMILASLLLLLSLIWQENRETVWRWWTIVAATSSAATPIRMVGVIYLSLLIIAMGVSLRVLCIQLYGRSTVVLWSTAAVVLSLAIPFSFAIAWFIQQTSREHVESELDQWRSFPSKLLYFGMAIKLVCDIIFIWLSTRQLVSAAEAIRIVLTWSAIVIAATCAWWMIWPTTQLPYLDVSFVRALMAAALAFPLSICFAGPLAVDSNRHRRI